jgi:hypothetical protein
MGKAKLACLIADEWDSFYGNIPVFGLGELSKEIFYGRLQGIIPLDAFAQARKEALAVYLSELNQIKQRSLQLFSIAFPVFPPQEFINSLSDAVSRYKALSLLFNRLARYMIKQASKGRTPEIIKKRLLKEVARVAYNYKKGSWDIPISFVQYTETPTRFIEKRPRQYEYALKAVSLILLNEGIFVCGNQNTCIACIYKAQKKCRNKKETLIKVVQKHFRHSIISPLPKCQITNCQTCANIIKEEILEQLEGRLKKEDIFREIKMVSRPFDIIKNPNSSAFFYCKGLSKMEPKLSSEYDKIVRNEAEEIREILKSPDNRFVQIYQKAGKKEKSILLNWLEHKKVFDRNSAKVVLFHYKKQ